MQLNVEARAAIENLYDERSSGNQYQAQAEGVKELEARERQVEQDKMLAESIRNVTVKAKDLVE